MDPRCEDTHPRASNLLPGGVAHVLDLAHQRAGQESPLVGVGISFTVDCLQTSRVGRDVFIVLLISRIMPRLPPVGWAGACDCRLGRGGFVFRESPHSRHLFTYGQSVYLV